MPEPLVVTRARQFKAALPPRLDVADTWLVSCDNCASQEDGKHYCLLHGCTVLDMDTTTCADWEWRA